MRHVVAGTVALALALPLGWTFSSTAQDVQTQGPSRGTVKQSAPEPGTHGDSSQTQAFTGLHTMDGEVTNVDKRTGKISIKTEAGTLDLHFPPTELEGVSKGDRITVQLAMKTSGAPASDRPRQ